MPLVNVHNLTLWWKVLLNLTENWELYMVDDPESYVVEIFKIQRVTGVSPAIGFPKAGTSEAAALMLDAKTWERKGFVETIEKDLASRKFLQNCQLRKVLAQAPQQQGAR